MPPGQMLGVGFQIGARFVEGIVELQVQMVGLQDHDDEHGGNGAREFPESVVHVLGLQRDALPEPLIPPVEQTRVVSAPVPISQG